MIARVFGIPAVVALLFGVGIVSTIVVSLASESERPIPQQRRSQETKLPTTAPKSRLPDRQPNVSPKKVAPKVAPAGQPTSADDDREKEPAAVRDRPETAEPAQQPRQDTKDVEPPPLSDAKILLLEGTFPARDVLRLYSDLTGLPVLFDGGDTQLLSRTIEIVAPIRDINEEMLKELLRSNRIALRKKVLRDGRTVVRVRSAEAANDFIDPEPIPIIQVERR